MSKGKRQVSARVVKATNTKTIAKADTSTNLNNKANMYNNYLSPEFDMLALKEFVDHSTILPQCIRAYKNNIAGFGIGVRYRDDYLEETTEMKAEYTRAEEIIDLLNLEMLTKEVFEKIIESRETYGIAYLEVIRNLAGEVVQIEFIEDTPTIYKTSALDPIQEFTYYYKGRPVINKKRFRKYKQEKLGKVVHFKEFGEPRKMNKNTGQYEEVIEEELQANEILEFKVGTGEYGTVRWIGQLLPVDGSRRAEGLNNNYFKEGRHTPLMIVVKGGSLSDESFNKLQEYMNGIKGEAGQHAFIVLETEDNENKTDFENKDKIDVEIKDMAAMLQKDELFQEYLINGRKKVQSSFLLPDLYVGYTSDFNRATAQMAMEVTEKQVFVPERKSLVWQINNKLLNDYQFRFVEVYFKSPDITNPDDIVKVLNVAERAGGVTPNLAKEVAYKTLGKQMEDYTEDWANIPIAVGTTLLRSDESVKQQIETQIQKAEKGNESDVVAVMKEVKKLLLKMSK